MIWVYGAAGAVNENCPAPDLSQAWDNLLQLKDGPLGCLVIRQLRADVPQQIYGILKSFASPMRAPLKVRRALNKPESLDTTSLANLYDLMLR